MYHVSPDHQGNEAVFGPSEAELAGNEPESADIHQVQPDPSIELINGIGRVVRLGVDWVKTKFSDGIVLPDMIDVKDRDITPPHDYPGV